MTIKHGFHLFLALFIAAVLITACGSQGGSGPNASQYSNLATGSASLSADSAYTLLHSFTGNPSDGRYPVAGLIMDNRGNLYGTTNEGGANNLGAIFKLDTSGTVTLLHSFGSSSDGYYPLAGLIMDHHGNLYGTTSVGPVSGFGTVYKLDPSGTFTVLHSFAGGTADGATPPFGSLIMDNKENLYGTTSAGGASSDGTIFKLDTSGALTLLHSFAGGTTDGKNPQAGLIMDNKGNLYGTTFSGGLYNGGTVFKLDTGGTLTLLHSFAGGTTDGSQPQAGLIMDNKGNLYGTTYSGGASNLGTIFELDTNGTLTLLHSFAGGTTDGSQPFAGLIMDNRGNLYGTTHVGGASNLGTVFKLDTSGTLTLLHSFAGAPAPGAPPGAPSDGALPGAALLRDNKGNLYGTTDFGGDLDFGTVFELTQ